MGHRSNDQSRTRHRTIPSTTSTMKIAIVSLVLVAAVSVNGGVLQGNGMAAIDSIIDTIDKMSDGATDLNKANLGTNTEANEHTNKMQNADETWSDVPR